MDNTISEIMPESKLSGAHNTKSAHELPNTMGMITAANIVNRVKIDDGI